MKKYLLLMLLLISSFVEAELQIKLTQPTLLLQQISASDLGIKPVLNEDERQYNSVISQKLKAKQYQSLLNELTDKIAAEHASAAMAYLVGQLALQQKKYKMAERYFKQAIKQQPNYGKAHHGLGLVELKLSLFTEANKNLSRALQLGINDPQLYSYLGYGYIQANNFHSAVVAYQHAKLFKPNDEQLNQALLYAYSQAGQSEAALSLLTQMLVEQPSKSSLWLHRANALLQRKNYPLVIASLETALRLGEKGKENIALTAQLQMQYGSIERAIQLYHQIWLQHANPQLILDAIEYLVSIEQLSSAKSLLNKVTAANAVTSEQQSQLSYLQGKISLHQGELSKAEAAFARALKHNSVNGYALLAAAQVKRSLGKSHQAQMLLLRASSINDVKVSAVTEHADLMMSLGRYAKALELLQQALAYAPNESSIFENVQTLQRLVSQSES
jgi:tetratricopeptide (TPR) repeat protein